MERIVITGIGAVTPIGNTFIESWNAVTDGVSGIRTVTACDAEDLPWNVAGEPQALNEHTFLSEREIRILDPFVRYAVAASVMAAQDAGLMDLWEGKKERISQKEFGDYVSEGAVIIGSSRGGIRTIEKALTHERKNQNKAGWFGVSPFIMPATTVGMASSYVAQRLNMRGYCLGISNACSSGANAVGEAYRLLRSGYRGPVVAGGADAAVCRLCLEGYGVSGALSKRTSDSASRPFDRSRDGFVLAEGACIMVLERNDCAANRGATVYGEITGYGNTADAFHQTKPDAAGQARAMIRALQEASLVSKQVDYLNTHGTGTYLGDQAESEAIGMVYGEHASKIPASAIKAMTGHMLAASGAFEVATSLMSLKEGIIPPTINISEQDHACAVNIVTEKMERDIQTAVSHSFGFGGVNTVLVCRKL